MKKIISIIITIFALGLIVFGSTYFMKNDNKNFSTTGETNTVNEENEKEEDNNKIKEPEYDEKKEKVKLYMFWGDGCPHCEEAKEWFDEIEPSYGKYFEVIAYEIWNDEDNAYFMREVVSYLNEEVEGVPYIIIGDVTYKGFAEPYKEKILDTIFSEYEKDERIDVIDKLRGE